ncbi:MAG: glycerophosphoryl diester phosphodiesterase [Xanthobacteraceae bacterium]|nr:glycerophosphoryl diester phosphodiesterase [Xanthobacteraceae bacterium]
MPGLDWLTARPVAHRGLHDVAAGIIENTPSAFAAAIAGGFGIECDVQLTADGDAMVHHDEALGRLTEGSAALDTMTAADLKRVPFRATADRMLDLGGLCDLVAGRVPLVIELKSQFDGDRRLAARVASVLHNYAGPVAVMSFDPAQVAALRDLAPGLTRGIVAERHYDDAGWGPLPAPLKGRMAHLLHIPETRPHFVAYAVNDLPALAPWVARNLLGLSLLTWTVRTPEQRQRAAKWADQVIFEGWRPD